MEIDNLTQDEITHFQKTIFTNAQGLQLQF